MKEYHTSSGGRSPYWHSSAASVAHEQAHWDTDWMKNVIGSTWPAAQRAIARVSVAKSEAASAGAAKAVMKADVESKIAKFDRKSTTKWNAVPDDPGKWFANGYKAGQRVVDGLSSRPRRRPSPGSGEPCCANRPAARCRRAGDRGSVCCGQED